MIYIAADHAGYELKKRIVSYLQKQKIAFADLGAKEYIEDDDYPDYASLLTAKMNPKADLGILICGSGQGVCMVANKRKGVRAAQAWSVESAKAARRDDNANVLCLSGREKNLSREHDIVRAFIKTPFSQKQKYIRRINKIAKYEDRAQP